MDGRPARGTRGSATVESAALAALIALVVIAAIAAIAAGEPVDGGRDLASTLGRKLRCAVREPDPCWRDPLTNAYGRAAAGTVRALAPLPAALPGPLGVRLLPVDFRHCRRASCAAPGPREGLTASNRRVAAFVSVSDERRSRGMLRIAYWLYRPGLGWAALRRARSGAEVAALARTPLLEDANPRLIPLETLDGRNHYRFAPNEEPPWRWRVESRYP